MGRLKQENEARQGWLASTRNLGLNWLFLVAGCLLSLFASLYFVVLVLEVDFRTEHKQTQTQTLPTTFTQEVTEAQQPQPEEKLCSAMAVPNQVRLNHGYWVALEHQHACALASASTPQNDPVLFDGLMTNATAAAADKGVQKAQHFYRQRLTFGVHDAQNLSGKEDPQARWIAEQYWYGDDEVGRGRKQVFCEGEGGLWDSIRREWAVYRQVDCHFRMMLSRAACVRCLANTTTTTAVESIDDSTVQVILFIGDSTVQELVIMLLARLDSQWEQSPQLIWFNKRQFAYTVPVDEAGSQLVSVAFHMTSFPLTSNGQGIFVALGDRTAKFKASIDYLMRGIAKQSPGRTPQVSNIVIGSMSHEMLRKGWMNQGNPREYSHQWSIFLQFFVDWFPSARQFVWTTNRPFYRGRYKDFAYFFPGYLRGLLHGLSAVKNTSFTLIDTVHVSDHRRSRDYGDGLHYGPAGQKNLQLENHTTSTIVADMALQIVLNYLCP